MLAVAGCCSTPESVGRASCPADRRQVMSQHRPQSTQPLHPPGLGHEATPVGQHPLWIWGRRHQHPLQLTNTQWSTSPAAAPKPLRSCTRHGFMRKGRRPAVSRSSPIEPTCDRLCLQNCASKHQPPATSNRQPTTNNQQRLPSMIATHCHP